MVSKTILALTLVVNCVCGGELEAVFRDGGSRLEARDLMETKGVKLHPDVGLNVVQMIKKYGYPCELHTIITKDKYVLTMQRIPHGKNARNTNRTRSAVLLMHGMLLSAADFIAMGPGHSLGYILADLGYDVWLGNARGSTWSKKHLTWDPKKDKKKFWDFSWHEIGYYDIPAKIDHILKVTGQEKLYYFGHSQGCTSFFVMAATRPEYNAKIRLSTMLGPPIYMKNIPNLLLRLVSKFEFSLGWISSFIGVYEFLPHCKLFTLLGKILCNEKATFKELCANIVFLIGGYDSKQLNRTMLPVLLSNVPAGASVGQVIHYAQGINTGKFRHFNYGIIKNIIKYGRVSPPAYDLSKITAPVALYYSSNDLFVGTEDVHKTAKELKNLAHKYLVPYKYFNHFDFLIAIDVQKLLYDEVLRVMKRY